MKSFLDDRGLQLGGSIKDIQMQILTETYTDMNMDMNLHRDM